jgi:hypothetical protein
MVDSETTTPEKLLYETAQRLGRIRDGRIAVALHLSRLRPQNRRGSLRVVERMLESMVTRFNGQLFILGNADVIFYVNQPDTRTLREQIHKLRGLFASDPLAHRDTGDGIDRFCTVYDLTFDYQSFLAMAEAIHSQARIQAQQQAAAPVLPALDIESLDPLLERLARLDISPFIRRQSGIALNAHGNAEVIYQEFFIGMADMQAATAPDIDLQGNRWMFQYISSGFDAMLLGAMPALRLQDWPRSLHLNLTVGSLDTDAFRQFEEMMSDRAQVGIEVQILDILANSRAFFAARDEMRQRGHRLIVDGLNEATLRNTDVGQAQADLYKIDWSPELRDPERSEALWTAACGLGADKLVLARCDSEAAIGWGLSRGLTRFQGRYVEQILAATTMTLCEQAHNCRLGQCAQRHSVVSGPLRAECLAHHRLDSAPPMRALQRKAAE